MNDQRIHHHHSGTGQRHLDADMETDVGCLSMDPVGWGGWYAMVKNWQKGQCTNRP